MIINHKLIQRLTFVLLILLLVGCDRTSAGTESADEDIDVENLDDVEIVQSENIVSQFSDDRLEGMTGIVENDQLQLYIDEETATVAVHDKNTGELWYTNPADREDDPIASGVNQDILSAQVQFSFFNNFGQRSNMNSYSDSVQFEQYDISTIDQGVRVQYQFGQAQKSADDVPLMLSEARFEELSSRLESDGQRALLIAYRFNQDTNIYERNDNALTGMQLDRAIQAFEDSGYSEEDLQADMAELNFTQDSLEARVFIATVEYYLEDDSVLVRMPVEEIYFDPEFPINTISFMRYFGAAGTEEEGSLFVPDGSGALIHFNNGRTNQPPYQQPVYGSDISLIERDETRTEETVRLPVFGVIKEDNAMLGIIESGASAATIHADVSGRLNSYNFVYPTFTVINKGDVTLQAEEQTRSLPRFQEEKMKEDFEVRYVFLGGDDASYAGLANYYQDYLVQQDLLRQNVVDNGSEDIPFYMNLIGSITRLQHVLGIPYQSLESLTTFEEAETIINTLMDQEVDQIKLNYRGWFNQGLDHRVPKSVSVDRSIGGRSAFEDFINFTNQHNISLYPETAMLQVHDERGFSTRNDAARTLTNVSTALYPVDLALNARSRREDPTYSLAPKKVVDYTSQFLDDFTGFDVSGIALRDLADVLNSDFRRNEQTDRTESEAISEEALSLIHDQGLEMMGSGGNQYALKYLTDVTDVPVSHTGFKIQNEAIPFYQMVIRGYLDYATTPFNLSTFLNDEDYVLKALEYGSNINFEWIHASNETLKNTDFNHLYSVNYERWIDQAAAIYHEVNDVLSQVRHQQIIAHDILDEQVFMTTYENGLYVIVNYGHEPYLLNGDVIEPKGYIVGGER